MPVLRALAADGSFAVPRCRLAGRVLSVFRADGHLGGIGHGGYRPFASAEIDSALGYTGVLAL